MIPDERGIALEPTCHGTWARRVSSLLLVALLALAPGCARRHRRARPNPSTTAGETGGSGGAESTRSGERIFVDYGCIACHTIDGSRLVGPSLDRIAGQPRTFRDGTTGVVNAEYLRESLVSPDAKIVATYEPGMPSYERELDDAQIDAVVEYLLSLR